MAKKKITQKASPKNKKTAKKDKVLKNKMAEKPSGIKSLAKQVIQVVTKEVKIAIKEVKPSVGQKLAKMDENKKALKETMKVKNGAMSKIKEAKSDKKSDEFVSRVDTKNLTEEQLENYKKWMKLHKQYGQEKAVDYNMKSDFEIKSPLKHKIHGWGIVMQRRDNYIDVLFETGMKTLVCNYGV